MSVSEVRCDPGGAREVRGSLTGRGGKAGRGPLQPGGRGQRVGASLYADSDETAVRASLGCGVPTAVADLRGREIVLDLGSGGCRRPHLGASRRPYRAADGIDMTDEMLEPARRNAADADIHNVEFRKGYLDELPLADGRVDVVISNGVINLPGDKPKVLAEAAEVLRPRGRSRSPM